MRPLLLLAAVAALETGCSVFSAGLIISTLATPPWPLPTRAATEQCPDCEDEKKEVDQVVDRLVPRWMELARQRAVADATATRTGYFSWDVSSSRGTTRCNVVGKTWRCDHELDPESSQQL